MRGLKLFLLGILVTFCSTAVTAQVDSGRNRAETSATAPPVRQVIKTPAANTPVKRTITDSTRRRAIRDSTAPLRPRPARDTTLRRAVIDTSSRRPGRDTTRIDSAAIKLLALRRDSLRLDSLRKLLPPPVVIKKDTSTYRRYQNNAFLGTDKPARFMISQYHVQPRREQVFYLLAGILFCLGFIKAGFPKYFRNLFLLFFQTSLRQKQTRDQLLQDNLASLLINLLFFISTGLYITLLIQYKQWTNVSFWVLSASCVAGLVLIYLGKFLFLRFSGWVFNAREAAGSYIFLVFLINKVMGVMLVPFLLILAFAALPVVNVAVTVSFGLMGLLFMYRYFVSFNAIRNRLKVNLLHFFLYLCAVEILPLLLIYKLLINYFAGSI